MNSRHPRSISRRDVVCGTAAVAGYALAAPFINLGRYRLSASGSREYSGPTSSFGSTRSMIWPRSTVRAGRGSSSETGGVMGITGVRNFVTADEPTTVEHYLDHFDHVRDLVGVEHLGIGSDIDLHGYDDMPADEYDSLKSNYKGSYAFREKIDIDEIAHPQRMFDVTEGLIRRGYTDDHIQGILGGNFQRVLGEIWSA